MPLAKGATIRQLTTFHTVARLGSVSLAADELHLSQSAVSIQIASLEAAAGSPLVARTGRGVRLTEAGELLISYTERLLAMWQETSDEMARFLGDFSGSLRVGAVTTAEYWLPRLLVRFVNSNPRVQIKLQVGNRSEIVRSLGAHDIDLAVMGHPPQELNVAARAFARNPMAFVAAPTHPLMKQRGLTMAMLAESQLLVRERGSGSRTTVERLFRECGLRIRVGSELSSNESIKQMCAAGFGPAYLSMHTCVLELDAGLLQLLPIHPNPIMREWYVVRMAARAVPHVTQAFESYLIEHAQGQIQHHIPWAWADETRAEPIT